jgi:threonine synthase
VAKPDTIATAIRIGNPASWDLAQAAKAETNGLFGAVSDYEILWMHRFLSQEAGVFVEPSSATAAAGLYKLSKQGKLSGVNEVVVTVTGHGLKDPNWALRDDRGRKIKPRKVSAQVESVAAFLGLEKNR